MARCIYWRALLPTLLALASIVRPATALSDEPTYELGMVAANCERMPTAFPFQGGDCVPAIGTVIVVTTLEGTLVGTCIAKASAPGDVVAGCSVPVPLGSSVVVTEDTASLTSGYMPTQNPQRFDMPSAPPDGAFGGPVFLNLPTNDAAGTTQGDGRQIATEPELVGEPQWWIVPNATGWGNTEEGHLYFAARVLNPTTETIGVGVSFNAYEADGTPFPGCHMPMGDGPGVTTTIAPGETAILRCSRTIVPNTLVGLQVTARLWPGEALHAMPAAIDVAEIELLPLPELSSPMETTFDVSALVSATGSTDVETALLFRFYDVSGDQVGTCETDTLRVEPEVSRRVSCAFPLLLYTGGTQPVSVRAEFLPIPE